MPTQQQQIDYGNTANDGQGDPLRTAFIKTDDNFDAIWAAGPVGSNVTIVNTTISTVNTNGNLILKPNGIGLVQANSHVVPNTANLRDLGSAAQRWRTSYSQSIDSVSLTVSGAVTLPPVSGITIPGGTNGYVLQTDGAGNLSWTAQGGGGNGTPGGANTQIQFNDAGSFGGDVDLTYNKSTNTLNLNGTLTALDATVYGTMAAVTVTASGNVSGSYILGNGSQLTGITASAGGANTQVQFNDAGVLSGNSLFTFNRATGNLHIDGFEIGQQTISGTTANANIFIHPDGSGSLFIQGAANALVHVQGDLPDTQNRIRIENYGSNGATVGGGEFQGQWTRGSLSSPQATIIDDKLAQFGGRGYDGANYTGRSTGWISVDAADNWTPSNHGTHISFWTTPPATIVPQETMRLGANGNLVLYTGNLNVLTGQSRFLNTVNTHDILPLANGIYSLGNSSLYWSNLWVANNTIYIGGVPLGMTAGNVLTVGGEPILSNDSNTSITTTGNITADYFFGNGSQLTGLSTGSISNGTSNVQIVTANGNVSVTIDGTWTWTFDTNGNLIIPNDIVGTSTIDIDNRATGNSADIRLFSADDILIQARDRDAGSTSEGGDINIYAGDSAENGDTSAGDVQIFAGNGGAANVDYGGTGGFVTIRSGDGGPAIGNSGYSASSGGDLTIRAGDAGANGGDSDLGSGGGVVYIYGGTATGNNQAGGGIVLTSGTGGPNSAGGNIEVVVPGGDTGPGGTWTFDNAGNLTLPTNGSIIVDGGDGVIGPVSDDMVISWDNEEIRMVSVAGSIEMQADAAFRVQTNYDGANVLYASRWEFNQDEIVNITGPSAIVTEAGNLNLQGGRDTLSSGNVTVTAINNGVSVNTWTFDNSGNLTAPGNIAANYFIGNGSQLTGLPASYSDSDVATFLAAYGSNTISTTGNITAGNFIGSGSNVELVAQTEQWVFDITGNLNLPSEGNIIGITPYNAGRIQWVGNSSGDGFGYTTLGLIPDDTLVGNDQYLIIDPTAPGHIHIRAGGEQDNSSADLFLGGENSYVKLPAGQNPDVQIAADTHVWTFGSAGAYGELTLPAGEGAIRTIDDTLALVSFNTTTGNANSVYLGSSGGLGFNDQDIGGNWLEIFRSGAEPEIRVPVGRGNLNIQTAEGANVYNWTFDNTGNLTLPTEGYLLVQTGIIGAGASPAPTLSGFSSIATTGSPGNISASGNLLVSGYANITGSINGTNMSLSGNITGNNLSATNNFQLPVYANTTVRDSSISSPAPGMMIYVTGTGMQVRGATSWNTIAGSGT